MMDGVEKVALIDNTKGLFHIATLCHADDTTIIPVKYNQ